MSIIENNIYILSGWHWMLVVTVGISDYLVQKMFLVQKHPIDQNSIKVIKKKDDLMWMDTKLARSNSLYTDRLSLRQFQYSRKTENLEFSCLVVCSYEIQCTFYYITIF